MEKYLKLEYRMYGLVPYNLSPIQQGIQFGHAVQEYNNKMFEQLFKDKWKKDFKKDNNFYRFQKWANVDKTFIILNGGTTNTLNLEEPILKENECNIYYKGSLNNHLENLRYNKVQIASFYEPDLGDQLTAVVFLVDERVWDKEKYPDRFVRKPGDLGAVDIDETVEDYTERLGGEQNVWLREFLSQFRFA